MAEAITVTPEMIAAGVEAGGWDECVSDQADLAAIMTETYRAMHAMRPRTRGGAS